VDGNETSAVQRRRASATESYIIASSIVDIVALDRTLRRQPNEVAGTATHCDNDDHVADGKHAPYFARQLNEPILWSPSAIWPLFLMQMVQVD